MSTAKPNAALLWSVARRLAEERGTFENTWTFLRDAGLGTTRENFVDVWRMANQARPADRRLVGRPDTYVPTSETIVDSPLSYRRRYAYRVAVHGLLPGTNDAVTRHLTVTTSRRISLGNAVTDAVASIFTDPELYNIDVESAEVVSVERSA